MEDLSYVAFWVAVASSACRHGVLLGAPTGCARSDEANGDGDRQRAGGRERRGRHSAWADRLVGMGFQLRPS